MLYFMSVHSKLLFKEKCNHILVGYTNLPTGTIILTIEVITVLYKRFLTSLQAFKSYPCFLNNSVIIEHSLSSWLMILFYLMVNRSVSTQRCFVAVVECTMITDILFLFVFDGVGEVPSALSLIHI